MSIPVRACGAQVRIDAELLAKTEETLLRAHRLALELGEADGGQKNGICVAAGCERLVGERRSLREDRVATEGVLGVVDSERVEHADRLCRDLRPDSIPRQHGHMAHRGTRRL